MTESEQAEAILEALNTALAGRAAYEYSKVPGSNGNTGTEPDKYVVVALSRRYVDSRRAGGSVMLPGGRLETRYVAKSLTDARNMRRLVTAALEDVTLTTTAGEVGPFTFESAEAFRPDETYQVGSDTWTF